MIDITELLKKLKSRDKLQNIILFKMKIKAYVFENAKKRPIVCVTINGNNEFYFIDKGPGDMITEKNP
jgi:hypothetical protein